MLAISLAAMVSVRRSSRTKSNGKPFQLAAPPLLLGLIVQLLLLPLAWISRSNNALVNGGYSSDFVAAGAYIFLLVSLAAILLARTRINVALQKRPKYWAAIPILTLGVVYVFFGLSHIRSVSWYPAVYVSCSIYTLLFALLWQFRFHLQATGQKDRFFEAVVWVFTAIGVSVLALVVLSQAIGGRQFHYNLSFISFAFAFSGFIFGISLAYAINRVDSTSGLSIRLTCVMVYGCAIVATMIWFGVLWGYTKQIPEYERFARSWDERHQLILAKREAGELLAQPPRLPNEILNIPGGFRGFDYWDSSCASDEITELIKDRYQA